MINYCTLLRKVTSLIASSIFLMGNIDATSINNVGILSPADYGANGSDNNDDSAAFQKCFDVAKQNGIAKIIIPPGRYIIRTEIKVNGVHNLIVEGSGAALIKPSGNSSNIFSGEYNSQITIRDISFEGNRSKVFNEVWPDRMNACAILRKSSGIRFENCVVKDFYYGVCFGTSTENGYDIWVINCQFYNCNSDIDLYGKPSLHIRGNVSHNCTGNSIQIEPPYKRDNGIYDYRNQPLIDALSVGNIISENVIVGCKNAAIVIFAGSEDVSISNNQIINYGACGIIIKDGSANISVSGNIISNSLFDKSNDRPWRSSGAGILLSKVSNSIISNNIISHANTGIVVVGTESAIIVGNKISDSKDSGICFYKAHQCNMNGNMIENFNLNKSWWANSGLLAYQSTDILISNLVVCDLNKSDYLITYDQESTLTIKDTMGIGYTKGISRSVKL